MNQSNEIKQARRTANEKDEENFKILKCENNKLVEKVQALKDEVGKKDWAMRNYESKEKERMEYRRRRKFIAN